MDAAALSVEQLSVLSRAVPDDQVQWEFRDGRLLECGHLTMIPAAALLAFHHPALFPL